MSDQIEQQGSEPITTVEVDCTTSAKGDVNVSWKVRVQMPTFKDGKLTPALELGDITEALVDCVSMLAADAKVTYIRWIREAQNAQLEPITDQEYERADLATEAEVEAEAEARACGSVRRGVMGEPGAHWAEYPDLI